MGAFLKGQTFLLQPPAFCLDGILLGSEGYASGSQQMHVICHGDHMTGYSRPEGETERGKCLNRA